MTQITWSLIKLPPVNLFNVPTLYSDCKHTHFMILHSLKIKVCYDCGIEMPAVSAVPVHQR